MAGFGGGGYGGGGRQPEFDPAPYCIPGEITVHEVMDMKRAFDMIDEDRSGLIDAEELQGAAVALGIPMEENIAVLLGTEKIPFEEFFKRMTAKLSPEDKVDDIMNIFELFDNDCTGTISLENLQNIARIIGAKESASEIQDMLSTLDTDGDGELDPIDFYTCLVSGMRIRMEEESRRQRLAADQMSQQASAMYESGQPGMSGMARSGSNLGGSRMR
jgi:Ca2+-binding EF-hand superfamily protein|mmetsp:Transcript_119834/g.189731  ORF Transcript_119834/g.189731 Transcript_119834/m.189731 type:complete len:217 (-) Transcript_119834:227-877(-)